MAAAADDAICHCKSEAHARSLKQELEVRMAECLLELHPEKTKIVYCKDANRRGTYPVLRGWIQYYGRFHRSVLINVLRAIDYALVHWAQRKYKTLHGRKARAWAWLNGVRARQPGLFPHWSLEGG